MSITTEWALSWDSAYLFQFLRESMRFITMIRKCRVVYAFGCHLYNTTACFLKGVSLSIVGTIHRQLSLSPKEPRHIVVTRSLIFALSRCCIHVHPLTVGLFLIIINLRGYYIGEHLLGASSSNRADSVVLALIQVAAKLQVSERLPGSLQVLKSS